MLKVIALMKAKGFLGDCSPLKTMFAHFSTATKQIQLDAVLTNLPAFQASPTCGFAVFSTHEANAIQTRHMSDCLSGRNGTSNPETWKKVLKLCIV